MVPILVSDDVSRDQADDVSQVVNIHLDAPSEMSYLPRHQLVSGRVT